MADVRHIETLNDDNVYEDVIELTYRGQTLHLNIYEAESIARRIITACYLPTESD